MKVTIDIDIDDVLEKLGSEDAYLIMRNFSDSDIMDAVEKIDHERGDWIFIDRMVLFLKRIAEEFEYEIIDAKDGEHISDDTYKILKQIQGYFMTKKEPKQKVSETFANDKIQNKPHHIRDLIDEFAPDTKLTEKQKAIECIKALSRIQGYTMSYEGIKRTPVLYDSLDYLMSYFQQLLIELDK